MIVLGGFFLCLCSFMIQIYPLLTGKLGHPNVAVDDWYWCDYSVSQEHYYWIFFLVPLSFIFLFNFVFYVITEFVLCYRKRKKSRPKVRSKKE